MGRGGEMPKFYAQHVGHQPETSGFDMSAARRSGANAWAKARAVPEQLLTEPRQWATLDYRAVKDSSVDAQIGWTVARSGTAHGFVAWFDTILTEDVGFSNAPDGEPLLYGNAFFPGKNRLPLPAATRLPFLCGPISLGITIFGGGAVV